MVGTFHVAAPRQKVAFAIAPLLEPVIEKLRARIAVSEVARETLRIHLDTDAVVIPNGISAKFFADAKANPDWRKTRTIGFIGRFSEPRKGLSVLLEALPNIARIFPDVKVLIAGPGEGIEAMQSVNPALRNKLQFLGRINDEEKASFLKSLDIYVAPNTGGESFGIILAEAMASGVPIVASDIPAFRHLLEEGRYGSLFENEDATSLAETIIDLFKHDDKRKKLSESGMERAQRFDWSQVSEEIMNVFMHARAPQEKVKLNSESRSWTRIFSREDEMT
jgi:phosphatidylinositol alpha-mannosyltransferase